MKRKPRRSKLRIIIDILKIIDEENGARITRILYGANLPYDRLLKYIEELKEKGFIIEKRENNAIKYYLTENGINFLTEFKKIESFIEAFGIAF